MNTGVTDRPFQPALAHRPATHWPSASTAVAAGAFSCYDLARDPAGSVNGLPKDLAGNPKYMEGFGQ